MKQQKKKKNISGLGDVKDLQAEGNYQVKRKKLNLSNN